MTDCEKCIYKDENDALMEENENLAERVRMLANRISEVTRKGDRICSSCGRAMTQGFCIDDGEEYYCSDECLHTRYSLIHFLDLYDDDRAYWTQWEVE